MEGFEPSISALTTRRFRPLSYTPKVVAPGFHPLLRVATGTVVPTRQLTNASRVDTPGHLYESPRGTRPRGIGDSGYRLCLSSTESRALRNPVDH